MASGSRLPPSGSFGGINGLASKPMPMVDLGALQRASRVLQDQFVKDTQIIPDLGDMLTTPGGQSSASYSVFPDDYRVPFQKIKMIRVPDALFQYYNTTKVSTNMGIIPEIERVWISIDHKLFLWDYVEGQELSSFMDQPDVITKVAAVKPKPGVFIDEISFLLVICTPISVLLIGLSAASVAGPNNRPHKEIKLYATDMVVSTDIEMGSVVGTKDGRIFMCGSQDGSLYELHYQEKEGWFGKRVQLINHSVGSVQSLFPRFSSLSLEDRIICVVSDLSRNYLYTLTAKNTISIYRTSGEKSIEHIQTISNLYKSAQEKAPGTPALTPQHFQIISIHVVQPSESRSGVQLVAMTVNGVRLYFSPSAMSYNYSYGGTSSFSAASRPLQLIHVRLPPSNLLHPDEQENPYRPPAAVFGVAQAPPQPTTRPYLISALENTCYCDGLTIAAQQGDSQDDKDFILCLSPDLTRIGSLGQLRQISQPGSLQHIWANSSHGTPGPPRPPLTEYGTVLAIAGRTWSIAVVPQLSAPITSPSVTSPVPAIINELATQFSEPPRQFMILTNAGLSFLIKRRALDYLKAVIEEVQAEGNVQPIIEFRDCFGRDQTCAMLLGLASGNTFLDNEQFGPTGTVTGTLTTISADLAAVAKQAFYDFGERPMWAERMTYGTAGGSGSGSAIFSGRREGLALYFSRLVRPLWKSQLTKPGATGLQQSSLPDITLVTVQKNLYALKDFLDNNPHLFHSSSGEPGGARTTPGNEQEAWKAEQTSVSELQTLLTRTIEAISFFLLLTDYRLGELITKCDADVQRLIASLTFEDLITSQNGMSVSRALVNVVIDQQIGQQISVDTISEVLQQRCGSFCSTDDVMLYKAKENVRKAAETRNPNERQNWLSESLRLFTKGARILEFDKLREVCGDYQQLSYAKGTIELPLRCAQVLDPDKVGFDFWCSAALPTDPRSEFYERRLQCYDLVLDSLSVFEEKTSGMKKATSLGIVDDPEAVRSHAYELAFESDDEMFHSTLYDWLIGRGVADELLEMRPAFLEAHLKRDPVTIQKSQLLWQFYVKDGQPLRAAEVLSAVAESTQVDLPLESRLEYLTLAVGNAKSHPISVGGRHESAIAFLTGLEEKLDVAQVQLELYNTLLPLTHDAGLAENVSEKVKLLPKRLFTMSELYQEYADPFDIPVMKLLVLHVSEHRDENLVRPIWNKIIEQAMEGGGDPQTLADRIASKVIPLGQRFYPSESAFPLRHIATLLVQFVLSNKGILPFGWAPRILVQCRVPYIDLWDVFHEMYESQIPPFNDQVNVQIVSSDIAVLLSDWLEAAERPQTSFAKSEFPVGRIDVAVDQYLAELEPGRVETKDVYETVKRRLRRNW